MQERLIVGGGTPERTWQAWPGLHLMPHATLRELVPPSVRTVVIAPHQDDEILTTGGLLAILARDKTEVCVVAVTDGGGPATRVASPTHGLRCLNPRRVRPSTGPANSSAHWMCNRFIPRPTSSAAAGLSLPWPTSAGFSAPSSTVTSCAGTPCPRCRHPPARASPRRGPDNGMGLSTRIVDGCICHGHGGFWGVMAWHCPAIDLTIAGFVTQTNHRQALAALMDEVVRLFIAAQAGCAAAAGPISTPEHLWPKAAAAVMQPELAGTGNALQRVHGLHGAGGGSLSLAAPRSRRSTRRISRAANCGFRTLPSSRLPTG